MAPSALRCVVGIDVAKQAHVVCVLEAPRGALRHTPSRSEATSAGYALLQSWLATWGAGREPETMLIGREATGVLWEPLDDALTQAGDTVLVRNPRQTASWATSLGLREPSDGRRVRARPWAWLPPRAASGKGRKGTHARLHPDSPPATPGEILAEQIAHRRWRPYRLLEGRKGPIVADFVALRALASRTGYREGVPAREVWVLIRRPLPVPGHAEPPQPTYSVTNAPADTPLTQLIRICGLRWPIECCFEEGKGELGMDHYELRFWRGGDPHMTLGILAHHFLVRLPHRLLAPPRPPPPPPFPSS